MTAAATAKAAEQVWDADGYARHGRFNYEVAAPAIKLLEPQTGNKARVTIACDKVMLRLWTWTRTWQNT